jgi:hypothetical protein
VFLRDDLATVSFSVCVPTNRKFSLSGERWGIGLVPLTVLIAGVDGQDMALSSGFAEKGQACPYFTN